MPTSLDELQNQITNLITQSAANAQAAITPGISLRVMQVPNGITGGNDQANPAVFKNAVVRAQLNTGYGDALLSGSDPVAGGTAGDLIGFKTAIDYLAVYERALQAANASRSRCLRWAAARRQGHGDPTYSVFNIVMRDVTSVLSGRV